MRMVYGAYVFEPLPGPGFVRLCTLQPDDISKPLVVSLSIHRLDVSLQFEALSYVWGSAEGESDILCDKAYLMIRSNLRDALYRLRDPQKERVMWIDRICINQEDRDKRSCQVQLMGSIFSMASRWLLVS